MGVRVKTHAGFGVSLTSAFFVDVTKKTTNPTPGWSTTAQMLTRSQNIFEGLICAATVHRVQRTETVCEIHEHVIQQKYGRHVEFLIFSLSAGLVSCNYVQMIKVLLYFLDSCKIEIKQIVSSVSQLYSDVESHQLILANFKCVRGDFHVVGSYFINYLIFNIETNMLVSTSFSVTDF